LIVWAADAILGDDHSVTLALAAVITMLAGVLGVTIKGMQHSREANRAVNDVGTGETRIFEKVSNTEIDVAKLVATQERFAALGWATLPPDIHDAVGLTTTIRALQHAADENTADHDTIKAQLVILTNLLESLE
jgi:hypothetical protein